MIYTIPDYYKEFHCIADKCEDTCCAGWQIVIDERAKADYKRIIAGKKRGMAKSACKENSQDATLQRGEAVLYGDGVSKAFRARLFTSVNWHEGTFRQDREKRCAFLNEENLCDLYTNCGEKSLCKTCKNYPRHIEEFEGVREITLSISCPEVARILLGKKEPVEFLSYEREGEEEYEDFDPFFFSILEDARVEMLHILQNRELPIRERVLLVLGMAHDMQVRINRQEMFDCMQVIEKYCGENALRYVTNYAENTALWDAGNGNDNEELHAFARALFEKQYQLELLKEEWDMLLQESEVLLYAKGAAHYETVRKEFATWAKEQSQLEIQLEQLLVYFLFTYFPGAVYDGEVYAKVQMAVYLTWMIYELFMARWVKNEKALSQEEIVDMVYRFSREVEHSDENLKQVEAWMARKYFLR